MSRRRKLLLLVLVVGTTAAYALWRAPEWGALLVEHALARATQRPVHVEALGVRLSTGELELRGLRVDGPTPDAPPFLEIPVTRVRPGFAPLRGVAAARFDAAALAVDAAAGAAHAAVGAIVARNWTLRAAGGY